MPHTTVEYSDRLADVFDRHAFGAQLHPLVAQTLDVQVDRCRTRFYRIEESVLGDPATDGARAMIRIELAALSGHASEVKATLSKAVLELVRDHVRGAARGERLALHVSVHIRDLDRSAYTWQEEAVLV